MEKYIVKLVVNDNTHPYDLKNELIVDGIIEQKKFYFK